MLVAYEDALIFLLTVDNGLRNAAIGMPKAVGESLTFTFGNPNDLKLFRVVLVEKRDGHTHCPVVVARDVNNLTHFDGVVVVVLGVVIGIIAADEVELFVAFGVVKVGEPTNVPQTSPFLSAFVHPVAGGPWL